MMKRRRCLSMALALLLALGAWTAPASAIMGEVTWQKEPASWAKEQMEDLANGGILGQGSYNPTVIMTRGRFCYFMVNIIHREGRRDLLREASPVDVGYFDDVTSEDGFGGRYNMYTAAAYGLTEGALVDGKRLANCDSNLTREQAAKMMCALMDALERYVGVEQEQAGTPKDFADADTISSWAKESVDRASALGLLKGDEAGRFNPQGVLTFQEACVMLDRAFRQAEQAALRQDAALGIQSLSTQLEEETDWVLTDQMTEMYWLEQGSARSVLVIHGRSFEQPGVWVESFDADGNSAGVQEIPMELEFCAGFYEGEDAYYLAFGQDNMEEDGGREVYRVVRYDKSWNRLSAASVNGEDSYTTQPFRSTDHVAMAEEDGTLILHTSRLRYLTPKDGLRHQSNITIKISTPDMTVQSVSAAFPSNHVSHSFAQYVAFDNGTVVYADHGDAYPRGFALNVENSRGGCEEMNFFSFSGGIGVNNTNAYPGGLGVSAESYLFAGSSSPQKGDDKRTYCNAFLAVVPKKGYPKSDVEVKWLTSFPQDENEYVNAVRLVPMNNNTFVVMWQSTTKDSRTTMGGIGEFRYAVFDGQGNQVGQTQTAKDFVAPLNDPTVIGNRIVWVRPELGPYGVFGSYPTRCLKRYELEIGLNEPAAVTPKPVETPKPTPTPRPTEAPRPTETPRPAESARPSASPEPVETPKPSTSGSTPLPADGRTDYYRKDWDDGKWMALEVLDGKTIRLSGSMPDLPSYYDYVVLQAYGEQDEVPLVLGEEFTLEVTVDIERFKKEDQSKKFYITPMVCQNHKPGEKNLAGFSLQGARVFLTLDDEGECTLRVEES